jgi:hypothetical protein
MLTLETIKQNGFYMSPNERVKVLREAPPETWIAFSDDESTVVAQASSYAEAVQKAAQQGVSDPVLVMTPSSWAPLVLL